MTSITQLGIPWMPSGRGWARQGATLTPGSHVRVGRGATLALLPPGAVCCSIVDMPCVSSCCAVSDAAPVSGCRGIVAAAPIALDDLDARGPLISVPQALQFTSSTAHGIITAAAGPPAAAAAAEQLSDTQLIAAALAHELHHAASSSWYPYLSSLPLSPPNPWLMTSTEQILAALQSYQQHLSAADASDWVAATAAARQQQLATAAEVDALLGSALGVSLQDVLSALGQVTSRSLVSGSSSGMCPVIDLVNHHASASAPMLQLSDADVLTMTVLPLREVRRGSGC